MYIYIYYRSNYIYISIVIIITYHHYQKQRLLDKTAWPLNDHPGQPTARETQCFSSFFGVIQKRRARVKLLILLQ